MMMNDLGNYLSEMKRCEVDLSMPKFTVEFGSSLKKVLEQQGVIRAFGQRAQFEGISDEPLRISDIMQKTYVKVDEDGTEAAAVTAVRVGAMSMRPQNIIPMKLDRPFVFAIIRNDGNEVLFVGKVGNPIEK
jgi:serpin B